MQASSVAGGITLAVVAAVGIWGASLEPGNARTACMLVGVGALVWYAVWGHSLKGWIGPSYLEMKREVERIRDALNHGAYANGAGIDAKERNSLYAKLCSLERKIEWHPDNPRHQ